MRTKESGVSGGSTAFPWALTLTLGWGKVEVPRKVSPRWSRGYSLGNSKKIKKNKHIFFGTGVNSGLLHKS